MTHHERTGDAAATVVLAWARLYTLGLASDLRNRRIAQLISDIHEQRVDAQGEGRSRAAVSLAILGRTFRGAIDDITWRFQVEGPSVQLNIPIQRLAGVFFVLLAAAAALSLTVNGYDASREGFDSELQRLADVRWWEASVYAAFQVAAGVAMIAGAAVLRTHLRAAAPVLTLASAFLLVAAGGLTLVDSGIYIAATDVADEWAAEPSNGGAATVARALLVVLSATAIPLMVTLGLGVYGFALAAARHHALPRWLGYVAGSSALALAASLAGSSARMDFVSWMAFGLASTLLIAWLAIAGLVLTFRQTTPGASLGAKPPVARA